MPSTGLTFVGAGANNADAGDRAWNNPGNILASENTRATTVDFAAVNETTQYLHGTMGGNAFAIPNGATIDGIVFGVEKAEGAGASNNTVDQTIQLLKAGVRTGDNKADTATGYPKAAGEVEVSYGSGTDLWGTTWSEAQVEATDFGGALRSTCQAFSTAFNVLCDAMRLNVFYTEAAGGTVFTISNTFAVTVNVDLLPLNIGKFPKPEVTGVVAKQLQTGKLFAAAVTGAVTNSRQPNKVVNIPVTGVVTSTRPFIHFHRTVEALVAVAKGFGIPIRRTAEAAVAVTASVNHLQAVGGRAAVGQLLVNVGRLLIR